MKIFGIEIEGRNGKSVEVIDHSTLRKDVNAEQTKRGRAAESKTVRRSRLELRADLLTLMTGLNEAENDGRWDREVIHGVFRKVWRDPIVKSHWNTRKIKTLTRPFFMKNGDGSENKEMTKLLKKPWFFEFLSQALDAHAWGFSLIELAAWDEKKMEFVPFIDSEGRMRDAVGEFPRDYVKPELGIMVQQPSDVEGDSFLDGEFSDQLIFIGKAHDLGFLVDVAAIVLIKQRTMSNWGEFAEVFGQDLLVAYSDAQGTARQALEEALKKLGSAGRMIADPETDEIKTVGNARRDAQDVYKELINLIDNSVAKRLFGQDVITNNTGKVVGTVGENVSNLYGQMDAIWLEWVVNRHLIPFMKDKGIKVDGTFEWDISEKLSLLEKMEKDVGVTKMGYWMGQEYIERTYGVDGGERVPPYFNRVQTEEGETEPHEKKNGPTAKPPKK